MAGTLSDESGVGSSSDGISNAQQRCQASENSAEWRSSEQVVNGIPSTSPFWDGDDYDDCGPKPSELYKKFEWKITKFSETKKRELRSDVFETGGYKWYILIYPQGCDVCNHLSLFLCVANHDDLLPGWSHFAQFTITVVNKDSKKDKSSDTLHRFWKKEHDWGWKKFMEISNLVDGFTHEEDTLVIKAQVQIIRDRADRPFRCLDTRYRRKLMRVNLPHVEKTCCRYLEKIRSKIGVLINDTPRWSSFCTYWLGIDENARRNLSRYKKDSHLFKEVIKVLFIEKDVTSTLVMDSLYSGIKSLEGEIKNTKVKSKYFDEQMPMPIVLLDKDTFVLVEDVVILLQSAVETLPSKDENGIPNHIKDGCSEEDYAGETMERDERRLTEIGRRTVELIITDYIFRNKIELAFQETVALKNQEELLREEEEEAAWLAGSDQKAKRGAAGKENKSKKKQGKQKRNNRKGKDKGREVKPAVEEKRRQESRTSERKEFMSEVAEADTIDVSDMSDSGECGTEDRESSPNNWDTDVSEVHHPPVEVTNGAGWRKSPSLRDDSSSTCSTDSLNGSYKGNSVSNKKTQKSPIGGWSQRVETTGRTDDTQRQTSECVSGAGQANGQVAECKTEAVLLSLQHRVKRLEQHMVKKEEVPLERKLSIEDDVNTKTPLKKNLTELPSPKKLPSAIPRKTDPKLSAEPTSPITIKKPDIGNKTQLINKPAAEAALTPRPKPTVKPTAQQVPPVQSTLKPTAQQTPPPVPTEKPTTPQLPIPSMPVTPIVSIVQSASPPSHSDSVASRLGPDPSPPTHSSAARAGPDPSPSTCSYNGPQNTNPAARFVPAPSIYNSPQSYRNATMIGNSVNLPQPLPVPDFFPSSSESAVRTGLSYGTVSDVQNFDMYMHPQNKPQDQYTDDFPHIDIINELLDDGFQSFGNGSHNMTRPYTFPGHFSILDDVGPSIATSSRLLEGTWSYPQDNNIGAYLNGRMDGVIPDQWQMNGSDLSYLSLLRNGEGAGYPYHIPAAGYLNMPYGVDGYTVYRP